MNIPLEQPWFLLLIPLGAIAVWKLVRQKGGIGFSTTTLLEGMRVGASLLFVERILLIIFISAGAIILARPTRVVKNAVPVYKQARDIAIVLDMSGSMSQGVGSKLQTARIVIAEFVKGRPQDRIAFITFEIKAYLEWPLSTDHETLIARLESVRGGDGTVIASGLIAALEHHQQFGQNRGAVIVVSDGVSEVKPEEKDRIEAALGKNKIYWIWIGEKDEKLALEFADYVRSLGGKVYQGEAADLEEIFSEISRLETSPVVWEQHVSTIYNFGFLPLLAFLGLLGAGLVDLLREV